MAFPYQLINFTLADATQVMANFNYLLTNGATFINPSAVPTTVGGISAGSTFSTAQTMQQMWNALLYPYQAPGFTSFGITGVAGSVEVGYSFGPSATFTWSTSNSGNVTANTIGLTDTTLSTTIATAQANSGSYAAALAGAVTSTVAGSHTFGISGTNSQAGTFNGSFTVSWFWRLYYGVQAASSLTAAQILALAANQLASSYGGTYSMGASGYKYLCLADAAGGQLNTVKDQSTGFNVPMNTGTFTDGGGFGYEKVSVTNAQSVTTLVRVYRTLNNLGGAVTLVVT